MKKTVLIGITSGIAAFKSLELITLLKKAGIDVFVIMTNHATQMVSPKEFEEVSGNKVAVDLFEKGFDYTDVLQTRKVDHIELADKADLMVIVPATANTIAKIAHGFADDFLTTTLLAVTKPILVCPSMNVHMWQNPLVQENITKLKQTGYQVIDPDSGMLACGYEGKGRLADVEKIKDEIVRQLDRGTSLQGKKVIVTAGGTREDIDAVRYITNRSSGKMGIAIAEECYLRGADVILLRASSAVTPRYTIPEETFTTADELLSLVKEHAPSYDYIYHTAAVSDFSIIKPEAGKISSDTELILQLKPTVKILDQIKKFNPSIHVIAFKAEYQLSEDTLLATGKKRLAESKANAIVLNDVGKPNQGFETDTNEVFILLANGKMKKIPFASKREVAREIVDYIN